MSWWKAEELKKAIDRCEGDVEAMIARGERPEEIEKKRRGIEMLYLWHAKAEREERMSRGETVDGGT